MQATEEGLYVPLVRNFQQSGIFLSYFMARQ